MPIPPAAPELPVVAEVVWQDACMCGEALEPGQSGLSRAIARGTLRIRGDALLITPHEWDTQESEGTLAIPLSWVVEIRRLALGRVVSVLDIPPDPAFLAPKTGKDT